MLLCDMLFGQCAMATGTVCQKLNSHWPNGSDRVIFVRRQINGEAVPQKKKPSKLALLLLKRRALRARWISCKVPDVEDYCIPGRDVRKQRIIWFADRFD